MSLKVIVHLRKEKDVNETLTTFVKTIKLPHEKTTYVFPGSLQHSSHHKQLFDISIVKNASQSITREDEFRNIKVTLPEEIAKLYIDDYGNFMFEDYMLEDQEEEEFLNKSMIEAELQRTIERLELQLEHTKKPLLYEIEEKFVLDKFTGRNQNANAWLLDFEKECERYKVQDDEQKIQCLRLFLDGSAKDWYRCCRIKLDVEHWKPWADSFLLTYADRGWESVRYAYSFKYTIGRGSLLDYALRKERLLLDCEQNMTETSRIHLVVVGLPIHIQDKLAKDKINSTEQLMQQLRKFDSS